MPLLAGTDHCEGETVNRQCSSHILEWCISVSCFEAIEAACRSQLLDLLVQNSPCIGTSTQQGFQVIGAHLVLVMRQTSHIFSWEQRDEPARYFGKLASIERGGMGIGERADKQMVSVGGVDGSLRTGACALDEPASTHIGGSHLSGRVIEIEAGDEASANLSGEQGLRHSLAQCQRLLNGAYQPDGLRTPGKGIARDAEGAKTSITSTTPRADAASDKLTRRISIVQPIYRL